MIRARFAPSPTGYLHIGSARTFIFNWLYVSKHQGHDGVADRRHRCRPQHRGIAQFHLRGVEWLELRWDEFYRQSERLDLHRKLAYLLCLRKVWLTAILCRRLPKLRKERPHGDGPWLCQPGNAGAVSGRESDARAAGGEPFVIRFRVKREPALRSLVFTTRCTDRNPS